MGTWSCAGAVRDVQRNLEGAPRRMAGRALCVNSYGLLAEVSMRTSVSVLVLACTVAACGGRAHDEPDAFHWQTQVEPGTTLHLSTVTGRIDVAPAPDRQLRVTGSTHSVGRNPIHFASRQDGDEVYVCALWRSRGNCSNNGDSFGSGHSWLDMFSLFKHRSSGGE